MCSLLLFGDDKILIESVCIELILRNACCGTGFTCTWCFFFFFELFFHHHRLKKEVFFIIFCCMQCLHHGDIS